MPRTPITSDGILFHRLLSEDQQRAFWSHVVHGRGPCWLWRGAQDRDKYGVFSVRGKQHRAHRVAYGLTFRERLHPDILVRHRCDNPSCVRPSHLLTGTQADNMADMIRRRRASWQDPTSPRLSRTDVHRKPDVTDDEAAQILASSLDAEELATTMKIREMSIILVRHGRGPWEKQRKRVMMK